MDIDTLKSSLADLLGLPWDSVIESEGKKVILSYMARQELEGMLSLPDGFIMTDSIKVPKEGEYFLDLSSLISEDRVIIYLATGKVNTANLILDKESDKILPETGNFDFLLCVLSGGKASYKGSLVQLVAPMVDSSNNTAIVGKSGEFKIVPINSLKNILTSGATGLPKSLMKFKKSDSHKNRLNLNFDDEGYDPWYGLN